MIVIVDYGVGNLGSIANMLKKVGAASSRNGHSACLVHCRLLPGTWLRLVALCTQENTGIAHRDNMVAGTNSIVIGR